MDFERIEDIHIANTIYNGKLMMKIQAIVEPRPGTAQSALTSFYNDVPLTLSIDEKRAHRSLNANNYCWVLCDKIAKLPDICHTSKEIYKLMIEDYGVMEVAEVPILEFEEQMDEWTSQGLGYMYKLIDIDKESELVNVMLYKGSSSYNTKQMATLLNGVVAEAMALGVEVRSKAELDKIMARWKNQEDLK